VVTWRPPEYSSSGLSRSRPEQGAAERRRSAIATPFLPECGGCEEHDWPFLV
jgi:hypothetical protein